MLSIYFLILFVLIVLFWGINLLVSVAFGAPNVSSKKSVIITALELANPKRGEKLIDLGCGWGKVLAIAENYGLKADGVDISPAAVLWNKFWRRNARIKSIFAIDLHDYDIFYIYLLPKLLKILSPKLRKLKKGARIVAISFPLPKWKPILTKKIGKFTIFLYRS